MFKILQDRLQQYVNRELPDDQAGFGKGRAPEIKLPTSVGSKKKQESFKKKHLFLLNDYAKAFDCVDHNKLCIFLKRWEYQTTWHASWEICIQNKKQQLELDM